MAQVSKYPISKEVYERIFSLLLGTVVNLRTKRQVSDLFDEFLTPTERIMFAKRLAIGLLLAKGYQYREISKVLKVSLATIGSMGSLYKYGKSYKEVIDKIIKSEKVENFWKITAEIIASVGAIGGKGSSSYLYLRNKLRKKRLNKPF